VKKVKISDIDLVTFLRYKGYSCTATVEDDRVLFVFDDENGEIAKLIEEYPTSEVNRILSIYHGIYKTVRSYMRNWREK